MEPVTAPELLDRLGTIGQRLDAFEAGLARLAPDVGPDELLRVAGRLLRVEIRFEEVAAALREALAERTGQR